MKSKLTILFEKDYLVYDDSLEAWDRTRTQFDVDCSAVFHFDVLGDLLPDLDDEFLDPADLSGIC